MKCPHYNSNRIGTYKTGSDIHGLIVYECLDCGAVVKELEVVR